MLLVPVTTSKIVPWITSGTYNWFISLDPRALTCPSVNKNTVWLSPDEVFTILPWIEASSPLKSVPVIWTFLFFNKNIVWQSPALTSDIFPCNSSGIIHSLSFYDPNTTDLSFSRTTIVCYFAANILSTNPCTLGSISHCLFSFHPDVATVLFFNN